MSDSSSALVLNAMLEEFGDNAAYALELYAHYRLDPALVDEDWRRAFRALEDRVPFAMSVPARAISQEPLLMFEPAAPSAPPVPAAPAAPRPAPVTARAGEQAVPIAGGAATIARNMEASLGVPTATTNRVVPVKNMEENRRILNRHREALGLSKVSFTHFVAWAIVRALEKHPGMNDAFGEADGKPARIKKPAVNLGIAIDITKKDGSRSLLVPNIKNAGKMAFGTFLAEFDTLVAKARKGAIEPDAFAGTTISLTNPGTIGTTSSLPRLMPGQGAIIATGAMGYPAEFQAMPDDVMSALGVSRVMNVSSTYDHRIIQGAESGGFVATLQDLLLGNDRFYDRIFEDLKVPHRPMRWEKDASSPFFGGANRLEAVEKQARVLQLINAYRVRGHLVADVNPLGVDAVPYHPDLDPATYGFTLWDLDRPFITNGLAGRDHATLREILEVLRQTYCGKIGAEFMYNQDTAQKTWLIERMEGSRNRANLSREERRRVLNALVRAEAFEKFLHTKYVGQKRFSLEGGEAAIALLDRLLDRAAEADLGEAVIGMSHRGRLTVLVNTVGKPAGQIFAEFEGQVDAESILGSGDVKYHLGAVGTHVAPGGQKLGVSLAPNPSHLEFVDPVVEGMVRAKQTSLGDQRDHAKVLPVLLHGDAAFAGQGIVAETLNMSQLHGYRTGGTVHVVVNNQIGFTTNPADARSSPYCTDVAKMVQAPVFHVNGDDAEAVLHVADIAMEYRNTFRRDVVIDMVCYRRYGHNEGDEPSYTQPLMYVKIKAHTSVARLTGAALVKQGVFSQGEVDQMWAEAKTALDRAYDEARGGAKAGFDSLTATPAKRLKPEGTVRERLAEVARAVSAVPEGFEVHPKLKPILKRRSEYASGRPEIDWAGGEMLAFGMLLLDGTPVRLSGQDSGRGTFSQRHSVLADAATGAEWTPLNTIAPEQAGFEVIDSLLSENAVMGFEFGYAVADPSTLVLWEGQFGDFANGAQVIIDQFISGSEQKWNQRCGLVLLLPHGQEGQGPEHSSARLERFLTLCAEDNMRVANVSTPAQYYHLLLRQMAGDVRKPLVVMTPKSLLRHPKVVSTIDELADGAFHTVLDDPAGPSRARRVILASGKVAWDLIAAREKADRTDVAIVRLEQYYPFPGREIGQVLQRYPQDAELVWVQEEPRNMGAWRFVREQFLDGKVEGLAAGRSLRYVGRRELASPAPGSHHAFAHEQEALVAEALRVGARETAAV
ncbi:MAG TPA: multifunctional oxoglutarate decarboxylase/oxoglutarate dehydrogenase thiamine pyrophosphate-binding subunit/dihydrolipoyllysine-residue succinyltransferase subunit [Thermoanaerobaculia bacterium]|jgi:2-oxoglutarate dehydrogenase E1 component